MAFKTVDIHGLVSNKSTNLWQEAMAFAMLYQMQGEDKPGKPLKEVYQMAFNVAKLGNPLRTDDAIAADAKADVKTVSDAIKGVWPYAATFYGNMSIDDKRRLSDLTAATARDEIVRMVKKHMEVLGKSGRSAYFAVIRFPSAEAMNEELALQAANAAKAEQAADEEAKAEADAAPEPEPAVNNAIDEPITGVDALMKVAMGLSDGELAELASRLNTLMIERAETAMLLANPPMDTRHEGLKQAA